MTKDQAGAKILLRIPEAVEATGYSRSFLYERIAAGEIRVVRAGRTIRIAYVELTAWINRQQQKTE